MFYGEHNNAHTQSQSRKRRDSGSCDFNYCQVCSTILSNYAFKWWFKVFCKLCIFSVCIIIYIILCIFMLCYFIQWIKINHWKKNVYLLYFVYIFSVGKAERENFFILNGKTNRKGKLNEKSFLFSGGFYWWAVSRKKRE